jgi:hypothetical protein
LYVSVADRRHTDPQGEVDVKCMWWDRQ